MSIIGSNILAGSSGQGGGYEIEQSLRFDGGSSLSRTFGSGGNRQKWTYSFWFKPSRVTTDTHFFLDTLSGSDYTELRITGNRWSWNDDDISLRESQALVRDPSAWYHVIFCADTTLSTPANRQRIYVNGEEVTDYTTSSYYTQNNSPRLNSAVAHYIGIRSGLGAPNTLNGYMAEVHFIDNQQLAPSDFGEYDDNGVWRPIEYTGSHGTNGFYLTFDPSATNGIGHDHSGNGNNWSPSGFTTSGTGTDVMSDTPTTNYPTLNPIYRTPPYPTQSENGTLSDGNLAITFTGANGGNGPTFSTVPNSGKWYFEAKQTSGDSTNIALGFFGNYTANFDNAWRIIHTNNGGGFFYSFQGPESGSEPSGTVFYNSGNILGIEIDMDNSTLQFHVNGTYATKATGLSFAAYAPLWIDFRRQNSTGTNNSWVFNFGQRAFEYTPNSGFNALNTANLPAPDIADGSEYFDTVTYTGNGTSQSISSLDFSPDLVWLKCRSIAYNHRLVDSVQGVGSTLSSNLTNAAVNSSSEFTSLDSNGFSITQGAGYEFNNNAVPYVAWAWDANGAGSSNTDGSITSTVSANPTAGFSIGTYTADGSNANRTVGHGLGVAPEFIIVKNRDTTGRHWLIWHKGFNDNDKALLFTTAAVADNRFGPNAPTSTVFGLYGGQGNYNSDDHVAYALPKSKATASSAPTPATATAMVRLCTAALDHGGL
jgi:hypothetical protein